MTTKLTQEEKNLLLKTARRAIQAEFIKEKKPSLDLATLPPSLCEDGACFVTLTIDGVLRGCVGSIEATQPLIKDVRDRSVGAAFQDYRFSPLSKGEIDKIKIEISRLTTPQELKYQNPEDLLHKLRPHVDGVILRYQSRRATFLPQVLESLPDPVIFLNRLCIKMGLAQDAWKKLILQVETYQVESFQEVG
jgi:AmmeMemoRadiSam system protein A